MIYVSVFLILEERRLLMFMISDRICNACLVFVYLGVHMFLTLYGE